MILPQLGRSENMRLPEDFEEQNTGKPVIYMFVGVCTFIVLLFAIMMILNMEPRKTNNKETTNNKNCANVFIIDKKHRQEPKLLSDVYFNRLLYYNFSG